MQMLTGKPRLVFRAGGASVPAEDRPEEVADLVRSATEEIWERRGRSGAVRDFYQEGAVRRSPGGMTSGRAPAEREVLATAAEFPDREILTEDVLCRALPGRGVLASQRMVSRATHAGPGLFGAASGRILCWRSMADRRILGGRIAEEWVITDTGAILRQLGRMPRDWIAEILSQGPLEPVLLPADDPPDPAQAPDPKDSTGARLADLADRIAGADFGAIGQCYDPGCMLSYPGGAQGHGTRDAERFWLPLRAAFPDAELVVHHVAGEEASGMPPRATLRWSLSGHHAGWGVFGPPSRAMVHVAGMTQVEFGPLGIRREWTLFDETAIWAQILAHAD
ncbi:nuclear transport factor 2 family protein [Mangrovicoccus algicola]|uniref:Ester cyclase n=1 Tax=Mangrovicoccus algicola TaxID=2771008 RepID=A0A8J6YUT5_9RHOB|nr:ester cyclase [Mangrovicoccus algicola]MBE3638032.1 ester cyclase [Mangrovicoccus algicola]